MSTVTVLCDRLSAEGAAVGTVLSGPDALIGKRAFVRGAMPGEQVLARVVRDFARHVECEVLEVHEPSPHRTVPPCPYFGVCGGCSLQHMSIQAQREEKCRMVQETLLRQGRIDPEEGVRLLGSDLPDYGYRRRITLQVDEQGRVGFYARGTGDVVEIERCIISRPEINEALAEIQDTLRPVLRCVLQIVLESDGSAVAALLRLRDDRVSRQRVENGSELRDLVSRGRIVALEQRGTRLPLQDDTPEGLGSFSQVNIEGNGVLIDAVLAATPFGHVTELYAGAGNFSVPLAAAGRRVTAVEVDEPLIAAGRSIAEAHGVQHLLNFVHQSCERYVRHHALTETLLLDPPRGGAKAIVDRCNPAVTGQICYVSCSLPTLVRDLKTLISKSYRVKRVEVVDMFPQTGHVETVTRIAC